MNERKGKLPLMASGKIVENYEPLIKYIELCDNKLKNNVLPTTHDIELVRSLVSRGYRSLDDIISELVNFLSNRFEGNIAIRAVREALNIDLEEQEAVKYLSKILAGWIIEMAENLGIIRISGWGKVSRV